MKALHGKFCRNCNSQNIALAASGQVMVARCMDCTNLSTFCPNTGCSGKMPDKAPKYKEQKCDRCGYETRYLDTSELQASLFERDEHESGFIGSVVFLPPC